MSSFAYNKLMTNYLELIEDKDEKTNLMLIFSEEINEDYNKFLYNKSDITYPIESIKKDITNIRNKKKEYREMEQDLNKLNNRISELGTRINKLSSLTNNSKKKKVKFLIPHTDEFRFMKSVYAPVSMFDIII